MKNKGFTLIELMIVIAIIVILASITVPTVLGTSPSSVRAVHSVTQPRAQSSAVICQDGVKMISNAGNIQQLKDPQGNGIPCN